MRQMIAALAVAAAVLIPTAGQVSAQGYHGYENAPSRPYGERYDHDRPRYRPHAEPYAGYGRARCHVRVNRYYSERRGAWVERRVRVCD